MTDNMELWRKVEKTDPKHTKKANVGGNQITAIKPQYQIQCATEVFGPYGTSWGFKDLTLSVTLAGEFGLVVLHAIFYYPGGDFPIINSAKLYKDNAKTKVDDDFAKKVETDALTKALSKLGFNADIFLGRFDDMRYVDEMNAEFADKPKLTPEDTEYWGRAKAAFKKDGNLDRVLSSMDISPEHQAQLQAEVKQEQSE